MDAVVVVAFAIFIKYKVPLRDVCDVKPQE